MEESLPTPWQRVQVLLLAVRRRWGVALAILVVAVSTTLALSLRSERQYDATAQILLQPSDTVSQTITPGLIPSSADAQRDVDTNAALITAQPVVDAVRRELRLPLTNEAVANKLTVAGQNDSNLVSLTARDANPEMARRIATSFAAQYTRYRLAIAKSAVNDALKAAQGRLAGLIGAGVTSGLRHTALRARVIQLEASAAAQTSGVQLVRPARTPTAAASPSPKRSAAIALIVGMMLALAAVLVLERVDSRLLHSADIGSAFELPVLAVLPTSRAAKRRGDQEDIYAELATRLGYVGNGGPRVLMVTACAGGSSADVTARLATHLAMMHRRVIIIEADLRAPAGESEGRLSGLRALLEGRSSLSQELASVHVVPDTAGLGRLAPSEAVSYQVLSAGGPVANPGAVLGRSALASTLNEARLRSDAILVQAASAERGSDALPIATLSDAILLMAEVRGTTREDAAAARRAFEALYSRIVGVVVVPHTRRSVPSTRGRRRPRPSAHETGTTTGDVDDKQVDAIPRPTGAVLRGVAVAPPENG